MEWGGWALTWQVDLDPEEWVSRGVRARIQVNRKL